MVSSPRISPNRWPQAARDTMNGLVLGKTPWPLFLWSTATGTGKTTIGLVLIDLANAIVRPDETFSDPDVHAVMMGFVDYAKLPRVLKRVDTGRIEWRFGNETAIVSRGSVMKRLMTLPIVVIDDVCEVPKAQRAFGEAHEAELKAILDARGRRPLIATSNLSPWSEDDAEPPLTKVIDAGSASDRISDRLTCGTVFEMPGQSRRRA